MKQRCLSFDVKVLNKAKYNLPWIKAESQTTKHTAIRMLLWQDIAVLSLQLAWSYFAINHVLIVKHYCAINHVLIMCYSHC